MKKEPNRWHAILDEIILGTAEPPPCVTTLRLPPIEGWEPGRVWGRWKVDPDMFHGGGALFGGYLAALADSAVGLAMLTTLEDDELFTTSDLRLSFFRPVLDGVIEYTAEIVFRGRRQAHVEVVFTSDSGKLIGKAAATQVITPAGG